MHEGLDTPGPRLPRTASTRSNLPETTFPDPDLQPNQQGRALQRRITAQQNPEETQLTVPPRLDSNVPARRKTTVRSPFLSLPPHSRPSSRLTAQVPIYIHTTTTGTEELRAAWLAAVQVQYNG